jgi:hypothetical protein
VVKSGFNGIYLPMQITCWLLVVVTLLLIGLAQISLTKSGLTTHLQWNHLSGCRPLDSNQELKEETTNMIPCEEIEDLKIVVVLREGSCSGSESVCFWASRIR